MKRFVVFAAVVAAAAACSSSPEDAAPIEVAGRGAPTPAAPVSTDCFDVEDVTAFTIVDDDTIRIEAGPVDVFEIDAGGESCASLGFANQIAIDPDPASGRLCVGPALAGGVRTDQGDMCAIQSVRRIAPAPVATPTPADG